MYQTLSVSLSLFKPVFHCAIWLNGYSHLIWCPVRKCVLIICGRWLPLSLRGTVFMNMVKQIVVDRFVSDSNHERD